MTQLNVLAVGLAEPYRDQLRQSGPPEVELRFAVDAAEIGTADVVAGSVPAALLGRAKRLRWVHSWAAGPDSALYPEMVASPIVLTCSKGNGAIPLAEHAMMLMLLLNRSAMRWSRRQAARGLASALPAVSRGRGANTDGLRPASRETGLAAAPPIPRPGTPGRS